MFYISSVSFLEGVGQMRTLYLAHISDIAHMFRFASSTVGGSIISIQCAQQLLSSFVERSTLRTTRADVELCCKDE